MQAAVITSPGDPEALQVMERPRPEPGTGEVLVRIRSSALNRADLLQRRGMYPAPAGAPPDIGGIEFAGEVVSLGAGAGRWRVGDRVFAIAGGGAHAEYCVAHEETLIAIPANLDWIAAGAIPEAFMTAHDAMIVQAALQREETVLVHAVASGVGLAAVQLARAWGARSFGTTRTAFKLRQAFDAGLHAGTVATPALDALATALRAFAPAGANVVLDLVGGAYLPASIEAAAPRARIMLIGAIAGSQATVDVRRILGKRLTLTGTVLRSRSLDEKIAVAAAFARDVVPLLESGAVKANVDRVFPFTAIAAAHAHLESNESVGKVVIEMPG